MENRPKRILVGVSGASGVVMSLYLVRALRAAGAEVHLIVTDAAKTTWGYETALPFSALTDAASRVYDAHDMAAAVSSGSYRTDGMIVLPCSMKTLAGVVTGYTDNLLLRAVDVCLKENRRVVLCPREMPLGRVHLRNLNAAAELGCVLLPPMLSFYSGQTTVEDQIRHIVGKLLMQFDLAMPGFRAWNGPDAAQEADDG